MARFDADLTQLLAATYIGGQQDESPTDLLVDSQGDIYLLGWTDSSAFPMPGGGYVATHSNNQVDGFVLKINAACDQILAGTYLAGTEDPSQDTDADDVPKSMVLAADNSELIVVGRTEFKSFPTTPDALERTHEDLIDRHLAPAIGCNRHELSEWDDSIDNGDGFLAVLSSDLAQLKHSTFLRSMGRDYMDAVFLNGTDIIVVGEAQANDFPMADLGNESPRGVILRFAAADDPTPDPELRFRRRWRGRLFHLHHLAVKTFRAGCFGWPAVPLQHHIISDAPLSADKDKKNEVISCYMISLH